MILLIFLRRRWVILTFLVGLFLAIACGYVGSEFGLYLLFRDLGGPLAPIADSLRPPATHSTPLLCHLCISLAVGCLYLYDIHVNWRVYKARTKHTALTRTLRLWTIAINFLPIPVLIFLSFSFLFSDNIPQPNVAVLRQAALGEFLATFVIVLFLWGVSDLRVSPRLGLRKIEVLGYPINSDGLVFVAFLLAALLMMTLTSAASAVLFILLLIATVYLFYKLIPFELRPVLFLSMLMLFTLGQTADYKYTIPGMDYVAGSMRRNYYSTPQALMPIGGSSAQREPRGPAPALLNRHDERKLVVISASGGGYRSAFWTALVLDHLRDLEQGGKLSKFSSSIKFLSGASGGAVGLSYYLVSRLEEKEGRTLGRLLGDLSQFHAKDLNDENTYRYMWVDSLSPVTKQMVQHDLFHLFSPAQQVNDRGRVLEDQWPSLKVSFSRLNEAESGLNIPSIILAPVVIERGTPLLVTNIPSNHFFSDSDKPTYDFFELFPGIKDNFSLGTAVRLSASFPVISPAVDLPTSPPVRIVDAGFFDNHGSYWLGRLLRNMSDPIIDNFSGVLWIEIDAFGMPSTQEEDCYRQYPFEKTSIVGRIISGFQWITSPLEAMLSIRETGMGLWSDADFAGLKHLLENEAQKKGKKFEIGRFKLSNSTGVSMSWALTGKELSCMDNELRSDNNQKVFKEIVRFWQKS